MAARPNDRPPTPDALVHDIEQTRTELATTIDQLVDRAHPKHIAARRLAALRARFVTDDGSPRVDQIAKVAGAVVGFVAVVVLIRRVVS